MFEMLARRAAPVQPFGGLLYERRWMVTELTKASEPRPFRDPNARAFLLRKLFSLTGVLPLAVFTLLHLGKKASALGGREAFILSAEQTDSIPFFVVFEVAFILLPLLLHAAIGIRIVLDARYNVREYPTNRNWMFAFQRVTGLLAFGFVAFHFYELRLQRLLGNMRAPDLFDTLCADLSSTTWSVPTIALLYLAGVAAVAFHLANGLWGALCSWGIIVSQRSQRLAAVVLGVFGIVVFALGANTSVYFATGSTLFVPSSQGERADSDRCSVPTSPVPAFSLTDTSPTGTSSTGTSPTEASPTDTSPTGSSSTDTPLSEPAPSPSDSTP